MTLNDLNAQFQRWHRSRELSGDGRTGTYARSAARRKHSAHLRERWVAHLVATLASCAFVWLLSLTLPTPYLQGLTVGVGFTAVFAAQWVWIVEATGTAYLAMGEQAEQSTATLLRKRRGWRVVNHVNLRLADIDHVFLGPDGIFAIETKWSSKDWTPEGLAAAARQAARDARDLTLWEDLRAYGPVRPLVVVWGPGTAELPAVSTIHGVDVVVGKHFDVWWQRRPLRQPALSPEDLDTAWNALSQRCELMDPNQPVKPLGILDLAIQASALVALGMIAFVAVLWAGAHLPLTAAIAATAVGTCLGIVVHRLGHGYGQWLAAAWLAGLGAGCALAIVAVLTS